MLIIITAVSLALALVMTVVAWRLVRDERRRAEARVAALAAEVRRDPLRDLPLRPSPSSEPALDRGAVVGELFATPAGVSGGRSRMAAVIALGVFIVGSGAALAVVLSGSSAGARVATTVAEPSPASPLELLALGHERDGDALAIHGIVRNPPQGAEIDGLSAVVFLFDRDGSFTTSARTPIDARALRPGAESRFSIVVPNARDVGRYRVSFRTDRGIVAHVDRRAAASEDAK